MKRFLLTAALAAVALAVVPAVGLGEGSDPSANAFLRSPITIKGKAGTFRVTYHCAAGGQALWVSAKQVASRTRDARLVKESSSKISAAWWDSHRNKFTCNGKSQTQTFTVDTVEPGKKGTLRAGWAWVQF